MKRLREKGIIAAATGLGLGFSPFAPGTAGALLGLPLGLALSVFHASVPLQIAIAALLVLLAIPVCDAAERIFGRKDDGRIVADEYMLLPICFIGQGPVLGDLAGGGAMAAKAAAFVAFAFVVSRIVDILKPSPCRQIQRVKGGLGIVLDDLFASIYSWIIVWALKDAVTGLFV